MGDEGELEKLLANEAELNRGLLSSVLLPYVRIGRESGSPIFTPEFSRLTNSGKIVVYLLSRKAASAMGVSNITESATPREISEATGISYGSVKPTVSDLARKHVLVRTEGQYSFPSHLLLQARELVK